MKKKYIYIIIAFLIINEVIDRLDSRGGAGDSLNCNEFREDFESYDTEINRDIWSSWDGNTNPIEFACLSINDSIL